MDLRLVHESNRTMKIVGKQSVVAVVVSALATRRFASGARVRNIWQYWREPARRLPFADTAPVRISR
jgi:hypothetical protein